jgi:pyrroline-5-carboxylate reductase
MGGALEGQRIGFVGGGAMAEALIAGLLAAGVPADLLQAADPVAARRELLSQRFGIGTTAGNADAVAASDLVVVAVKPGLVAGVLASLVAVPGLDVARPLWISIAAGVPLQRFESILPAGARVVRAMPNTPALVRAAATAFCASAGCSTQDRARAQALFETVGAVWEAPVEALLDAVTGLSGSGPAYVFVFLEALSDAGVGVGLPREAASLLACQTVLGAARLVLETGRHPAQLKDQVTSPGGTTIAGLERLEAGGFRDAIYEAVAAATARSRELGTEDALKKSRN